MAKYNPENPQHRLWLAENVLTLLDKWNFKMDEAHCSTRTWEFVLSREDKFDTSKKIVIYTGINKQDGCMRKYASDRIRVVAGKYQDDGEFIPCFKQQLNRSGEFKAIKDRLCEAILAAQSSKPRRQYPKSTDAWNTTWGARWK